ncbi:MAG: DUF1173 family protein [Dermatophilaceae bacterium]
MAYQRDRAEGRMRYADAGPTRARLARLLQAHVPVRALARVTGLSDAGVRAILYGSRAHVQRATAARVAGLSLQRVYSAQATGHVPRVGAVRRVQALLAMGWSHPELAAAGAANTPRLLTGDGDLVTVQRWRQVRDVYERLGMTPGPSPQTRGWAKALGYAPPLAWDEASIDDPAARPQGEANTGPGARVVDLVAVRRAVDNPGVSPPLNRAEQTMAVRALAAAGASDPQIADRLGVSDRTVLRWRHRAQIPAGRPALRTPAPGGVEWAEAAAASSRRPTPTGRPIATGGVPRSLRRRSPGSILAEQQVPVLGRWPRCRSEQRRRGRRPGRGTPMTDEALEVSVEPNAAHPLTATDDGDAQSRSYRVCGLLVDPATAQGQDLLGEAYTTMQRPLCCCTRDGVPMYVARVGARFVVKRMPDTGSQHSCTCPSYAPEDLCGLGDLLGDAVRVDPDSGHTLLRLGFPLSVGERAAPEAASTAGVADTVATGGRRLSLRALLDYLWHEADLVAWSPGMTGKRHWGVVSWHLREAARTIRAKGHPLAERVYLPEPFRVEHKAEISARRITAWQGTAPRSGRVQQLMVLIAEVKTIQASRHGSGYQLLLKHMPDAAVFLDEDLHRRMTRRFARELDLWTADEHGHLIAIATFAVGRGGYAAAQEIALMPTTQQWLPCSDPYTKVLLDSLVEQRRRFRVALRFSLPAADPFPGRRAHRHRPSSPAAPVHRRASSPSQRVTGCLRRVGVERGRRPACPAHTGVRSREVHRAAHSRPVVPSPCRPGRALSIRSVPAA